MEETYVLIAIEDVEQFEQPKPKLVHKGTKQECEEEQAELVNADIDYDTALNVLEKEWGNKQPKGVDYGGYTEPFYAARHEWLNNRQVAYNQIVKPTYYGHLFYIL